jgi:hypothetical protein
MDEGFHTITASSAEQKKAWRKGIHVKFLFYYSSKPIDRLTHIRITASNIDILYCCDIA